MTSQTSLTTELGGESVYQGLNASLSELPKLISAQAEPSLYSDSTHQLFYLQTQQGAKVLKRLNRQALHQPFWANLKALFGLDLAQHLDHQAWWSQELTQLSRLGFPKIEQLANPSDDLDGFVLMSFLSGQRGGADQVRQAHIEQLAQHLKALQQTKFDRWGVWSASSSSSYGLPTWSQSLSEQLEKWLEITHHQAWWSEVEQAKNIEVDYAVPTMLDLRWDQFLFDQNGISALVDLDAFVLAPPELSWVILEYLLDEQQAWWLAQAFDQVPDLSRVRTPYRLWLFSLNLLGENDLARWMNAPKRFDLVRDRASAS